MKPTSRARAIARWLPLVVVVAAQVAAWTVFESGGLGSVPGWLALLTVIPLCGTIALVISVVAAIVRRSPTRLAIVTALASLVAIWPGAWNFGVATVRYPFALGAQAPALTARLPLDGEVRVVWGGDDVAHNRHATTPDQRWAYDLVVEPALTGSARLEDYGCYGKDVRAPIDGEVWSAHDGEPEQRPGGMTPNYRQPLGNYVALRSANGTFVLVAHLMTGSVVAHEGARVEAGDPIGRCGNSGNTSEPHVHIHHQRQDPRLYPVNFAEGLPLYFALDGGDAVPLGGVEWQNGRAIARGAIVRNPDAARATLVTP